MDQMISPVSHYESAVDAALAAFIALCKAFHFETEKNHGRFESIGGRFCDGCTKHFRDVLVLRGTSWRAVQKSATQGTHLYVGDIDLGSVECAPHYDDFGNVAIIATDSLHDHWDSITMVILTAIAEEKS